MEKELFSGGCACASDGVNWCLYSLARVATVCYLYRCANVSAQPLRYGVILLRCFRGTVVVHLMCWALAFDRSQHDSGMPTLMRVDTLTSSVHGAKYQSV